MQCVLAFLVTSVFLTVLVSLALVGNVLQILLLPVNVFSPAVAYHANSYIAGFLWTLCDLYFRLNGCSVELVYRDHKDGAIVKDGQGPKAQNQTSAIVISNHRFFGDFFLIHKWAIKSKMLPYCKYFAKDSLKWVPGFGWGMWLIGFIMVKREWMRDAQRITRTFNSYISMPHLPVWIVSYVEGSRFTPRKCAKSGEYARERGLAPLKHLLLPRTRGFTAAVNAFRLSKHVQTVYDLLLIYSHPTKGFGATPTVWDFFTGKLNKYTYTVHVTRYDIKEIPEDPEEAGKWLYNVYEKNDLELDALALSLNSKKQE